MSAGGERGFASDNHAGAHPRVMEAIAAANVGHADSYGADEWTARAEEQIRRHLGDGARAYPVFNGTGANVLCLETLCRRHEAVICTDSAHIHVDECGAPERLAGIKLLTVATEHGKLKPDDVGRWDAKRGDEHHVQPRVVSITQSSELGTVYSVAEIAELSSAAHEREMYLHVDGARIANAAASLGASLREIVTDAGVDAISFGGTKDGMLFGEAAVFLGGVDDATAIYGRKQLTQLASKMRFIGAQFEALLGEGDLWLENASHANAMAARLADGASGADGVELVHPVEANAVFARLAPDAIDRLMEAMPGDHPFYVWDDAESVVRWVCSWDTTEEDVDRFLEAVRGAV